MQYQERKRWLFFGLPFTFTKYTVNEEFITIDSGFLNKKQNDCYLYKVVDVHLARTFMERLFGLGTVHCFGGDVTHPELVLVHIRHAAQVKDFILHASEEARLKRRTLNTQNIGSAPVPPHMEHDFDSDVEFHL